MRTELDNETCAEIADLIEGFAIGGLDASEMLLVAERIADCPEQQEQLRQYEETVGLLGLAVPRLEPPAALWDRLNEATAPVREPARVIDIRHGVVTMPRWLATAMAAAAVLLLFATVGLGMALRDANDDDPMFDETLATYLTAGGELVTLNSSSDAPEYLGWDGRGSLLMAPGMEPMLIVDKCVPSSNGYTYVVWLQRNGQRTPMGQIEIEEDGRGMMKIEGADSMDSYDVIGISIRTDEDRTYEVITGSPKQAG
jgi:hypothetical protein